MIKDPNTEQDFDPFYEIVKQHEKDKKALNDSLTDASSIVEYLDLNANKEERGVLFNPADVRTFEEWVSPKNSNNYLISPDYFTMFEGVKTSSRKNSRRLSDEVVQMFE